MKSLLKTNSSTHFAADWQFRQVGTEQWFPAQVPGCNFTDLLDNKLIDEPFWADNETKLQWIEEHSWEYQCFFDAADWPSSERVYLVFNGLDCYCSIYLNDQLIAQTDNMFLQYKLDCKKQLKPQQNHLRLVFESPIKRTRPLFEKNGFVYPAENDKSDDRLSVYSRKAPYHFGWDWGPRFVTSGIWKPVEVRFEQKVAIEDVHVQTLSCDEQQAELQFDIQLSGDINETHHLDIRCPQLSDSSLESIQLVPDESAVRCRLTIIDPKLWWPNGLGEAFLHDFSLALRDSDLIDEKHIKVGIRTVEVINEPDEAGETFYFKVNGHPVFMKGANYIPSDSFVHRVSKEKLAGQFAGAVDANMNMLRIWGGGIYQPDHFYDMADEHGILIWQDFMFACSLYPGDEDFLDSVAAEAAFNVKRLRNHACLAMWCGNNEVAMGISDWGWPEKFGYSEALQTKLKQDYQTLFHEVLAEAVQQNDSQKFYLPSSPIGFWEHPEQDGKGNSHYWGVWHGELPFSEYRRRIPRFMSEFGFQSFPLIESIKRFVPEQDWQLESDVMQVHQKHPRGNGLIRKYMLEEYKPAKDFASLLYLSQVQQAQGIKQAFEAHRKHMPFCMGTLYWQFNDCWPVASWSGIDYFGRWKALHYQAKRSFAPIIALFDDIDGTLELHIANDKLQAKELVLRIKLCNFSGEVIKQAEIAYQIAANSSANVNAFNGDEWDAGTLKDRTYLLAEVVDSGEVITHACHYFVTNKAMALTDPELDFNLQPLSDGQWQLNLRADTLVKDLHIGFGEQVINPSDNFFDLYPNTWKSVIIPALSSNQTDSAEQIMKTITFFSVVDSHQKDAS